MVLVDDLIRSMEYWSISDVLLPFILIFTVVYAVMQKSKILGKESDRFNVVIALVLAMSVVIPHVLDIYPKPSVVDIINASLPQVSLIVVAIIMFLVIIGIFAKEIEFAGASLTGWAVLLALISVFSIFGSNAGWFSMPSFLSFLNNPEMQSLVVIILVFGIIIWFVTHEPNKKGKGIGHGIGEIFGEWMKGKH